MDANTYGIRAWVMIQPPEKWSWIAGLRQLCCANETATPDGDRVAVNRVAPGLTLYGTVHCHLCEEAVRLIVESGVAENLRIVDVAEDEVLFRRYGSRIPVLVVDSAGTELNWPFDHADIARLPGVAGDSA